MKSSALGIAAIVCGLSACVAEDEGYLIDESFRYAVSTSTTGSTSTSSSTTGSTSTASTSSTTGCSTSTSGSTTGSTSTSTTGCSTSTSSTTGDGDTTDGGDGGPTGSGTSGGTGSTSSGDTGTTTGDDNGTDTDDGTTTGTDDTGTTGGKECPRTLATHIKYSYLDVIQPLSCVEACDYPASEQVDLHIVFECENIYACAIADVGCDSENQPAILDTRCEEVSEECEAYKKWNDTDGDTDGDTEDEPPP